MKDYSSQKEEIATIKKRNISISLSDADCERLSIKAGLVGLTVDELLRNFIGDLVDGTYTNGSDECMYANEWFNRCLFSFAPEETLLNFLLTNYGVSDVDYIITASDEIEFLKDEIASPDCFDDIQAMKRDLEDWLEEFKSCLDDFLKINPNVDIKKEIALCRKWLEEYEQITLIEPPAEENKQEALTIL